MKTVILPLLVFLSFAVTVRARTFPPVLLSADLENHGRGGDAENKVPQHYLLYVAPYEELGSIAGGGARLPSVEALARIVQAALPNDRFVPMSDKNEAPDTVIAVQWGEVSREGPQPFIGAREGGVVRAMWAIGVGRTHVQPFLTSSDRSTLNDELIRDRYFLVISSYDPAALRQGKVSIHWQTRTSIDSIQVNATEAWGYLAGVAQTNLAKLIDRPVFVSDAPNLSPAASTNPLVPLDEIIPGSSQLLTFEKAMPPF